MPAITVKPPKSTKYDLLSLGEIMLRMDPGDSRIRCARNFDIWEGGGEYNVALHYLEFSSFSMSRFFSNKLIACFGMDREDVSRISYDDLFGALRRSPVYIAMCIIKTICNAWTTLRPHA